MVPFFRELMPCSETADTTEKKKTSCFGRYIGIPEQLQAGQKAYARVHSGAVPTYPLAIYGGENETPGCVDASAGEVGGVPLGGGGAPKSTLPPPPNPVAPITTHRGLLKRSSTRPTRDAQGIYQAHRVTRKIAHPLSNDRFEDTFSPQSMRERERARVPRASGASIVVTENIATRSFYKKTKQNKKNAISVLCIYV